MWSDVVFLTSLSFSLMIFSNKVKEKCFGKDVGKLFFFPPFCLFIYLFWLIDHTRSGTAWLFEEMSRWEKIVSPLHFVTAFEMLIYVLHKRTAVKKSLVSKWWKVVWIWKLNMAALWAPGFAEKASHSVLPEDTYCTSLLTYADIFYHHLVCLCLDSCVHMKGVWCLMKC